MPSVLVRIRGRVQGVGFRFFAAERARARRLAGHARNLRDGSVEIYAEGAQPDLEDFLGDLRRGPSGARVEACDADFTADDRGARSFDIR